MIMNNNNLLKLSFAQGSSNNANNINGKSSQSSSQSGFKSVLDSAVNNSGRRLSNNTPDSSRNSADNDTTNTKVKYNSFREVQMSQRNASGKVASKPGAGSGTSNVNTEMEKPSLEPEKYDEQITALAQMLGITPGQLADLAKQLGYSLEDLKDVKQLTAFMDKVSGLLQLDDNERETLIKLAEEVSRQTNSEVSAPISQVSETNDQNSKADSVSNVKNNTDITQIASTIKEKLDALIQSGKNSPDLIRDEVSQVMSAMRAQSKVTVDTQEIAAGNIDGSDNAVTASAGASEENDVNKLAKTKEAAKETNSENADNGSTKFDLNSVTTSTQTATAGDQNNLQQDQQNLQFTGDIKTVLANSETHAEKAVFSMRQPVRTSEVLNQVVEQAKVILGQDKSEMVIQLKPDHLGKLELKVVTEQGIVAAKFIAENQRVKEIIETNMQLLKDSLQKQGISVDGVSVQVGQDSRSDNRNANLFQSRSNGSISGTKSGTRDMGSSVSGVSILENLPERLAQYSNDANTINLTA